MYLVTGAMGCIGAWTLYHLAQQDKAALGFDLSEDRTRLNQILSKNDQKNIVFVTGDISDFSQLNEILSKYDITHIIHLAALQVPAVRAQPILGSRVNVTGTVNIFEGARQHGMQHLTLASSIAVYGPPEVYPPGLLAADAPMMPDTLYGVFKVANEHTARIYWQDHHISSIILRPYTVYGVGRDQGLTSEPTKAMLAATKGENYEISFGGKMQFHLASDVAQQFILASEQPMNGTFGFNLGTPSVAVQQVAELIMAACPGVHITVAQNSLPFPEGCDGRALREAFEQVYATPVEDGIRQTIQHFASLVGGDYRG